jgi:ribosomal protein L7Ae-like RNA K-turn-binding protein
VGNKAEIRLRAMLGFAMRAGRLIIGTELVCSAMAKDGKDKPKVVLLSNSASAGTKKKISTKAEFYGVDYFEINLDSDELGRLLGKLYAPATLAITDDGFAREIKLALTAGGKEVTDN